MSPLAKMIIQALENEDDDIVLAEVLDFYEYLKEKKKRQKDILWKNNGDWVVTKWVEKDVPLEGRLAWIFGFDYTGFKEVYIPLSALPSSLNPNINSILSSEQNFLLIKYSFVNNWFTITFLN